MRSKILLILEVLLLVAGMMTAQACFVPVPYGGRGGGYYGGGWGYGGGNYWHGRHGDDDGD